MAKKVGRNDPCPCGSGKKYKNCCSLATKSNDSSAWQGQYSLQFSGLDAPKIVAYLGSHDSAPIIDYLVALQLNPMNNGKNLRIEHLCQLAVSTIGQGDTMPDLYHFKNLIDEEYPYDMMEDTPINLYSETAIFHGGNYAFFPGLSTHCSELFRAMTEAIYQNDGVFSNEYKAEIYQGVLLLLEIGDSIALRAGIEHPIRGNSNPRDIIVEPTSSKSYAIPKLMISDILHRNQIDEHILENFTIDPNDKKILTLNPEENPILYKPLLELDGSYYFIGICNQGCAINNYILKTSIKYNCISRLVNQTQENIWHRIVKSCVEQMHWMLIEVAEFKLKTDYNQDVLFRIDDNWIAYVCYAKDTERDVSVDGEERKIFWNVDERIKQSLSIIRSDKKTKGFHVLTLMVYSSMGEPFALTFNEHLDTDYLLQFSAFDFLQLVQTEKWDNMSLVRYARTKANTPSLSYGFNQPLDCYSLYKHKGECFYLSDDPKPHILQIEPNEGCELIHESKEKLNLHGTPIHLDGNTICYIPVQRDMDYASIYNPLNSKVKAKCCESYSIPIWIRCLQTEEEGENPSSIIDTIITAIAYWMDRLRPSIESYVTNNYKEHKEPIEIYLRFEEKTLSDKYIHYEQINTKRKGIISVSRRDIGVDVYFDNDYLQGFLGADNSREREMMNRIVSTLLDVPEYTIQTILDKHMPLGSAKMILMTEASNSPISFPLWLNPPIYIHAASSQYMLDLFPIWMKEKSFDISGRLETKEQKVLFLHNGVDVLYEKLYKVAINFDSHLLLRRLINNHETLLYLREHNKMFHPAQILCFGDNESKRKEILETERKLSDAGLATRAMIEYVAAIQWKGGQDSPGSFDIEGMLAIMNEIVSIGGVCDAVHLEVSDHTIEKLASGRYGIYDDDFNDNVFSFASARSVESVNNQIEDFEDRMEQLSNLLPKDIRERSDELDDIDEAFSADWGVSFTVILKTLYGCYLIAMKIKKSVVELDVKTFIESLTEYYPELKENAVHKALEHISLEKRNDYLVPPRGMDTKEIFPWIYNRELSYLRRPIVKYQNSDGSTNVIFGFRSCLLAGMQLRDLLYSGRLRYVGDKIEAILGKFQAEKGKAFNEVVRNWLQEHTSLKVWPYDVSIDLRGCLVAQQNLGDIDVLAYDNVCNVLYSIECKNTNTAKNVREMKKEMDDYLGRGNNPEKDKKKALVYKHLNRHQWLMDNLQQVMEFVNAKTKLSVKSMMLTSEVIPTSYLRKEDTPLSILNFQELKYKGVEYLNGVKDIVS